MKRFLTLFLMLYSMTVFAFANGGTEFVSHLKAGTQVDTNGVHQQQDMPIRADLSGLQKSADLQPQDSEEQHLGAADQKECPCKEKLKQKTLICGIALAPACMTFEIAAPIPAKERFDFFQAGVLKGFVSTQKRPPRTFL